VFAAEGITILASQAPRANAICEKLIGTLHRNSWTGCCSTHRCPAAPSLGQLTPARADTRRPEPINVTDHRIRRTQVLGGLTHEYYVTA
jgi:putative transposase